MGEEMESIWGGGGDTLNAEEPYGLGEHSEGGSGKVHEAEATSASREEGNMLTRVEVGGERDFFLSPSGGGSKADNGALHGDKVTGMVW